MPGRAWTAAEDMLLQQLIAAGVEHRAIGQALGGRSPAAVTKRWHRVRRGVSKRNWSVAEDAFLRDTAGYKTAEAIAQTLGRSTEAVHSRAEVLRITWWQPQAGRNHTGFTANAVARLLGIPCAKTVAGWIAKGYLEATRHAGRLGDYRRAYRVYPEALRVFLRDYPWLFDRRSIRDRGWRAYVDSLPHEEWIGTREAGRLLFMTTESVAQAIRRGYLRAEKVGPNWLIPLSAIRAYEPPASTGRRRLSDAVVARRAATLAARKSVTYTLRPETVARLVAARAASRQGAA